MKRIYTLAAVVMVVFALMLNSVEAKPTQTIEQQVNKRIKGLMHYGVFDHITYEVNNGIVTLSGKVNSLGTKSEAAAAVKDIPGVTGVVNNIEDLPPSPFDDSIRRRTLIALANAGLGGYFWEINPDVRIIVDRGRVTLEGFVMNSGDRNRANIIANGISG